MGQRVHYHGNSYIANGCERVHNVLNDAILVDDLQHADTDVDRRAVVGSDADLHLYDKEHNEFYCNFYLNFELHVELFHYFDTNSDYYFYNEDHLQVFYALSVSSTRE